MAGDESDQDIRILCRIGYGQLFESLHRGAWHPRRGRTGRLTAALTQGLYGMGSDSSDMERGEFCRDRRRKGKMEKKQIMELAICAVLLVAISGVVSATSEVESKGLKIDNAYDNEIIPQKIGHTEQSITAHLDDTSQAMPAAVIKGPYLQNVAQNSIVIMWETDEATPSLVEYGPPLTQVSDPNNVKIHEITITGLVSGTYYYYRVSIDGSDISWTNWSTFRTSPDTSQAYRVAVYGDTRTYPYDHLAVVHAIINSNPEIVLNTGDLVERGKCYYDWSPQFFSPAAAIMRNTSLFPVLGNHEYEIRDGCTPHMWYYDFFSLPGNEQWYAFTYGSARFIGLDTNVDFSTGSAQYNWLVNELESSDYYASKWQFVFFHHPPYTSGTSHIGNTDVQNYLVPLFEHYGVDIAFNGHVHNYERSYKDGIYYIVTGGGGAPLADFHTNPFLYNPYSQVRVKNYHHVTLDITPQQVKLTAWLNDGSTFDTFRITECRETQSFQDGVYPNLSYAGTRDTYISEENPNNNYGNSGTLLVDGDDPPSSGQDKSVLLKWNVSSIPPGSTIISASITIHVTDPTDDPYKIYELKRDWVENEATWNDYSSGNSWQSPGANGANDRDSTVLGTVVSTSIGYYTINLNTDGIAMIQSWTDNAPTNHGVIIADASENNGLDFDSSEASTAIKRPRLTIEYDPPGCPPEPSVSISTDEFKYSPGDTMTVTIDIANPTEDSVMFQWYWVVPQFSICVPVMSVPLPAGYNDMFDFSFTIPDWGPMPFGNVFYVQLLDADGEVLDADVTWWAYSPGGEAMPAREVDIAKEIKKTVERVELPS